MLHFWRSLSLVESPDKHYLTPKVFGDYAKMDPFVEVAKSLDWVKDKL